MQHSTSVTTTHLLEGLLDPTNDEVWCTFDARFRPIIIAVARYLGLGTEDAEDVAQQTLLDVVRDYRRGKYVRGQGRLRWWILGIARHRVMDMHRRRFRRLDQRGDAALVNLPDDAQSDARLSAVWDAEQERAILQQAMSELRESSRFEPQTLLAFEMVARCGAKADFVAAECGMTVAAERILEEGIEGLTKRGGTGHSSTQSAIGAIVRLYDGWEGRESQAAPYRRMLEPMP